MMMYARPTDADRNVTRLGFETKVYEDECCRTPGKMRSPAVPRGSSSARTPIHISRLNDDGNYTFDPSGAE